MSVRIYNPHLIWTPGPSSSVRSALERVLELWRGTPYESGQRFRGRAADCIGAVSGVIDDLDGQQRASLPGLPHDAAMHNRERAIIAVRELVRRYSPCTKVEHMQDHSIVVEPGDIVVTGMPGGGPGHVEMVGPHKNTLWHSIQGSGFHQGGWSLLSQQVLYAVYRIEDKWRWK